MAAEGATTATAGGAARGPGFFAPDIHALLAQRQAWRESLEDNAVLCSDDLSSQSSEFDGGLSDDEETKKASIRDPKSFFDEGRLNYEESKKRFANLVLELPECTALECCSMLVMGRERSEKLARLASVGRLAEAKRMSMFSVATKASVAPAGRATEPAARRFQRVRTEVDAMLAWAAKRKESTADPGSAGNSALALEAAQLNRDLRSVAELVRQGVAPQGRSVPADAAAKKVWLPPQDGDQLELIQNLVGLNKHADNGQVSYTLEASMGQKGGWLAAAETETLTELEARIAVISEALGKSSAEAFGGASGSQPLAGGLAGTTVRLHRRLDALHQVHDEVAAERFGAFLRLLSTEIDSAVSEARHFQAIDAETSQDAADGGEDNLAQQVSRLHEQVSGLDAVARRVHDVQRQLTAQEDSHRELLNFSRDLADCERQAVHAAELLKQAAEAAGYMRQAVESSRAQMVANICALERRLVERQARHPGDMSPEAS